MSDTNRFLVNVNSNTFLLVSELIKKYKLDVDKQLRQCYLNSIDVSTLH